MCCSQQLSYRACCSRYIVPVKRVLIGALFAVAFVGFVSAQKPQASIPHSVVGHLGFDRNEYPGDASLKELRRTFEFAGYWLNNPPGASSNSWAGKRAAVATAGFGFLVVFNGRTDAQIKAAGDAAKTGESDGAAAADAARREGFPRHTIIFLDQEEGGRLLTEQRAYVHAWADAVESNGFRAGVYCSGISAKEASGVNVVTAEDIQQNAGGRRLSYWVSNDACPPSLGCAFPKRIPKPELSGVRFADVWQFAQSPRRADFARGCSNYSKDGSCYPPGVVETEHLHFDLNVATSADPSRGR